MRILTTFLLITVLLAPSIYAGGPDVSKPMSRKMTKKVETIEPVQEPEVPEVVKRIVEEDMRVPEQPSDTRPKERVAPMEQPEPSRAPTEKRVTVLFESMPENAELFVNGLYVGSTPVQIPLLDGVHNVKMQISGYISWERQIKVYRGLRVYGVLQAEKKPQ